MMLASSPYCWQERSDARSAHRPHTASRSEVTCDVRIVPWTMVVSANEEAAIVQVVELSAANGKSMVCARLMSSFILRQGGGCSKG